MIFVGIDSGLSGAVASMNARGTYIEVHDIPTVSEKKLSWRTGKTRPVREHDVEACADLIRGLCDQSREVAGEKIRPIVVLEAPHTMPHDGRCSARTFGVAFGIWLGILGTLGIKPLLVLPQVWKRAMLNGIANDPEMEARALLAICKGRLAEAQLYNGKKLRPDRVDAIFLAEYGRRMHRMQAPTGAKSTNLVQMIGGT